MSAAVQEEIGIVLNGELSEADYEWSFVENGGHSLAAVALSTALKRRGLSISAEAILICRRLSDLVRTVKSSPLGDEDGHEVTTDSSQSTSAASNESRSGYNPTQIFRDMSPPLSLAESTSMTSSSDAGPKHSWLSTSTVNRTREHGLQTPPATPAIRFEERVPSPGYHAPEEDPSDGGNLDSLPLPTPQSIEKWSRTPLAVPSVEPTEKSVPPSTAVEIDQRPTEPTAVDNPAGTMTEMQLSLIHGSMKYPGSNIVHYSETYASEYVPLMRMAWQTVTALEPIFQTTFPEQLGGVSQPRFIWDEVHAEDQEDYNCLIEEAFRVTAIGHQFRVITWKPPLEQSRSTIVWSVHHALIDGFAASLVFEKVRKVVVGLQVKAGSPFQEVAAALREFQKANKGDGDAFWRREQEQFTDARGDLVVPVPIRSPEICAFNEISVSIQQQYHDISKVAQAYGATPASLLHAAWALVLSIYTDSDTVVFGSVFSGRNLPLDGIEDTVGPMVNTLPVCVHLGKDSTSRSFVRSVFEKMIELSRFQWTTLENGFSRQFDTALASEFSVFPMNYPLLKPELVQFGPIQERFGHPVAPLERPKSKQITDIPLCVAIEDDGILRLRHATCRFSRENVERIGETFKQAILSLLHPHATLKDTLQGLISVPMLMKLKGYGNCVSGLTTRPSIKDDLVTLFEKAVEHVPDNVAVEKGDLTLTYRDLDAAAAKLAAKLSANVGPGDVVCVHSDRSIGWIIAIYAILKSGAVYSSMDVALPPDLKDAMFRSAGAKAFLVPEKQQHISKPKSCGLVVAVDEVLHNSSGEPVQHRKSSRPADIAYLCFTSGSTGAPKGVLCTHEGLVAFQRDLEVRLFAQPGRRISQVMSAAFDGSIHEIFSALSYGGTIVLPDGSDMFSVLSKVDSAILTPSIARVLDPANYPKLKAVYFVGETVPPTVANVWARCPGLALYNMFGPTEGTCGATIKRLVPNEPITIGPPNPSTRLYILDRNQNLLPSGCIGEIYLAGVQVARGYIGLPEVTAERFLPDPVCRIGEMMYKTGDRGYWTEEGEVVCLGRNDREIKLRGFRLDMNDLEIRITRVDPDIKAVAVAPKDDQLVALVQPASVDVSLLREKIAEKLPQHAIPTQILATEKLPMTGAGKIDYKAIVRLFSARPKPSTVLSTATQRRVAAAFRSVLRIEKRYPLSASSNFTELGGTSLMQISLSSTLTRDFGLQIPLRLVIERDNLGFLAEAIDSMQNGRGPQIQHCRPLGDQQVSPIEEEWLEKYDLDAGSSSFNVFYKCNFTPGSIDPARLTHAFNAVLARHPMLRSRYICKRGKRVTRSYSNCAPRAERVKDISVWLEANRPFQLDQAHPVRVFISGNNVMVSMSHIVADFTTLEVFLAEVGAVYQGQALQSPAKTYRDSTVWYEVAPPCYLQWWAEYLANAPKEPMILKPGQERSGYHGTSVISEIPVVIHKKLRSYSTATNTSLQQLAMAAVAISLSDQRPSMDMVLGSPYINRPTEEDRAVIGLFLEPLPVRITYDPEQSAEDGETSKLSFLQTVRKSMQAALAHAIPWHQLLEHLDVERNFPSHPLFDVVVSFHDIAQTSKLGPFIPRMRPCFVWSEGAKFKLMCEFNAFSDDKLMMRLEYDTDIFTRNEIRKVEGLITRALTLLADEMPFQRLKADLRGLQDEEFDGELDPIQVFGTEIGNL